MRSITNRYTLLAVLYYSALCVLSHIPGNTLAKLGVNLWDKAVHFSAYFILGALISLGVIKSHRLKAGPALLFSALLILSLGAVDEIHQLFVANRSASIGDVIADTLGGIMGILASHLITKHLFKTRKASPAR
jgi:VanZ family protein